eukprot:CAMPEP_0179292534 /NCGR_PEP_ID=MMETSP0797-20121207/42903_1 /TAXON_ID=47934 /ORGANISM="Dinophysis acuminata, Strain DAEP01" /LENGTH=917 /DNA_ID=CAMNT_0021001645 /DNA_START=8 /DNA_END=2761 /DNA_ORIENTATION=-
MAGQARPASSVQLHGQSTAAFGTRPNATPNSSEAFYVQDAILGALRPTRSQVEFVTLADEEDDEASQGSTAPAPGTADGGHVEGGPGASLWRPLGGQIAELKHWNPPLYNWVISRIGTKTKACLIISFVAFEVLKVVLADHASAPGVNIFSILVFTNFTSLCIALWLSFLLEGEDASSTITSGDSLWNFMGVAVLFTLASALLLIAARIGTPAVEIVTVGYIYMPVSVILSYFVFRRPYGNLEWLSVGMMTLAILTFVLLREESRSDDRKLVFGIPGFGLIICAVGISVLASILAERIFKRRRCSRARGEGQDHFCFMKVHLDLALLVVSVCLWVAPRFVERSFGRFLQQWSHSKEWFGLWGRYQVLMVLVAVGQGWAAGLVTKEFSTVIKAIVQTLSQVSVMFLSDPLMGNRFHFTHREVPSILLIITILMSAIIFQTGRLNLKVIRKAVHLGPEVCAPRHSEPPNHEAASPRDVPSATLTPPRDSSAEEEVKPAEEAEKTAEPLLEPPREGGSKQAGHTGWLHILTTYALIIVYIVSDAGRTILIQKSLSSSVINSTSMTFCTFVCGALVASGLTLYTDRGAGLRRAWHLRAVVKVFPAAFLFALSTTLTNIAFALGISPSLYVVLGKFYTPVAAVGASWVMRKFYMWLEWFALLILTIASVVFGYLKKFDVKSGVPNGSLTAMLLVLCSAATSAFASLLTEKILKDERDEPFHLQKVRLDVGSTIASLALLPGIGLISTRPQDVPWAERPVDWDSCPMEGASAVCWSLRNHTCSAPSCDCDCIQPAPFFGTVFAGWDNWVIILALAINTIQGWLVGKVTQRFSTVHRAIADSFSLLALYFICDPLFNGTSLSNMSLNLVAFIVPLSTATFAVATSEMQKVMQANTRVMAARTSTQDGGDARAEPDSDDSELSDL